MIYDTVRDRLVRVVLVDEHQAKCVSNPDFAFTTGEKVQENLNDQYLVDFFYQRIEGLKHKAEIFADRLTDVKKMISIHVSMLKRNIRTDLTNIGFIHDQIMSVNVWER